MIALQVFNLIAGSGFCVHAFVGGHHKFAIFFAILVALQANSIMQGGLA